MICRSSSSRIDDGYDDEYRLSSCDEALTWLKENQERAQVYLETENGNQMLRISGRYGFETTFMAYFNQAYFDKELLAAIVLLLAEFLLLDRRNPLLAHLNIFRVLHVVVLYDHCALY